MVDCNFAVERTVDILFHTTSGHETQNEKFALCLGRFKVGGLLLANFLSGTFRATGSKKMKNSKQLRLKRTTTSFQAKSALLISHALTYKIANMIKQESFAKGFGYKRYDMIVGNRVIDKKVVMFLVALFWRS